MTHHFNVTGQERKNLVKAISDFLGVEAKYLRVPTCAYQIGGYNVSKAGTLTGDDQPESSDLLQALADAGFHSEEMDQPEEAELVEQPEEQPQEDAAIEQPEEAEPEMDRLTISLPRFMFDAHALENLEALISAKGTLMKRAFKAESLELKITDDQVCFPWFKLEEPAAAQAYSVFVQKIAEMAINQKRISAKEKDISNEKYEFRCLLLRLGLIGDEHKATRKQLLKNLSGSAAFKSGHKKGGESHELS